MDRVTEDMQAAGLIDQSLRLVNNEKSGFMIGNADLAAKRQTVEEMVNKVMLYDDSVYGTYDDYEHAVTVEVENIIKATGRAGSTVLSAVVSTLERTGLHEPPVMDSDEDGDIPRTCS